MEDMPKLEPGMVVKINTGTREGYCLVLIPGTPELGFTGHLLEFRDKSDFGACVTLEYTARYEYSLILEVFGNPYRAAFPAVLSAQAIQRMFRGNTEYLLWKRPVVKEMTIKQIEDELGYPIKVVKG